LTYTVANIISSLTVPVGLLMVMEVPEAVALDAEALNAMAIYASCANAMSIHLLRVLSVLYINPRVIIFDKTVVVGRDTPPATYAAFQPRLLAVPSSLILIISFCPLAGLPEGAPKVAPVARAVRQYRSVVSALGVGVADEVVEATRGSGLPVGPEDPVGPVFPVFPGAKTPVGPVAPAVPVEPLLP
jgi:hypothetical protein